MASMLLKTFDALSAALIDVRFTKLAANLQWSAGRVKVTYTTFTNAQGLLTVTINLVVGSVTLNSVTTCKNGSFSQQPLNVTSRDRTSCFTVRRNILGGVAATAMPCAERGCNAQDIMLVLNANAEQLLTITKKIDENVKSLIENAHIVGGEEL